MKNWKKLLALTLVLMLALAVAAPSAFAADYPSKSLYAICPWGAGGGTDACLRAYCAALEKQLGQTITVDNLTGASGVIGHEAIADADPDGYTFGIALPSEPPGKSTEPLRPLNLSKSCPNHQCTETCSRISQPCPIAII